MKNLDRNWVIIAWLVCITIIIIFSGCTGSTGGAPQFRILTPYGDFDGNTSQTITLDTRLYFPQFEPFPPPFDYSLYGMLTLET